MCLIEEELENIFCRIVHGKCPVIKHMLYLDFRALLAGKHDLGSPETISILRV